MEAAGDNTSNKKNGSGGRRSSKKRKKRRRGAKFEDQNEEEDDDGRKLKKKKKELTNFYRFQMLEEKIGKLQHLRQKFEQDKERIAKMRQHRKFKPF